MKLMHKIGVAGHSLIAESALLSAIFFRLLAFVLPCCGRSFRARYLNNLRHVTWPPLALPPPMILQTAIRALTGSACARRLPGPIGSIRWRWRQAPRI